MPLWSFQGARRLPNVRREPARGQVSQNSAVLSFAEVDVFLGELVTGRSHHGRAAHRSKSSGIPRKEVIQPQLPLRLPCYDFTPVTDPTFDGFLPCGLGHRLRVLPASMV